ncbi:hypothetical protein [Xenorhabdus hominickii]|uniref:Acyl-CoA dehydrogenase n=1 Tax=Xenorhabdus hominickii TaxID=351679 RepID=A0A2G0QE58_XENHO|nr:hypothetical protein [Xenorhabdus hominickii]AOM41572.1 hypothetical protein A9255_13905 [Xenorhabdus hominickii]PHM57514.1 acyl-CoA dehydrogenase [Xenorhabdus hominickii]
MQSTMYVALGEVCGEIVESASHFHQIALNMRTLLREKQDEHNKLGTYSQELHELFLKQGFYRLLQPKRYGGFEFSLAEYYRVMLAISEGHPSLGWNLTLAASHVFLLASHWPEYVQDELFNDNQQFIAAHKAFPAGTCKKVDQGYIIDGFFSYCSGITYSTHVILNVICDSKQSNPYSINCIIPRRDFEILNDWGEYRALGMWASGSNSVRLDSVFVPERMTVPFRAFYADQNVDNGTEGTRIHRNPMYLGYLMAPYHANLLVPIIGASKAALEEFRKYEKPGDTNEMVFVQTLGLATLLSDSAEAILFNVLDKYALLCQRWERHRLPITVDENLRLWGQLQQAGRLASESIETLFRNAGTSAALKGSRLLQYFNDAQMYRGHIGSQKEQLSLYVGRSLLNRKISFLDL